MFQAVARHWASDLKQSKAKPNPLHFPQDAHPDLETRSQQPVSSQNGVCGRQVREAGGGVPGREVGRPLSGGDLSPVHALILRFGFPSLRLSFPSTKWARTQPAHWTVVHVWGRGARLTQQEEGDSVWLLPRRWPRGPFLRLSPSRESQRLWDAVVCFHSRACISSPGTPHMDPGSQGQDEGQGAPPGCACPWADVVSHPFEFLATTGLGEGCRVGGQSFTYPWR